MTYEKGVKRAKKRPFDVILGAKRLGFYEKMGVNRNPCIFTALIGRNTRI
jgi:hypothetical protein